MYIYSMFWTFFFFFLLIRTVISLLLLLWFCFSAICFNICLTVIIFFPFFIHLTNSMMIVCLWKHLILIHKSQNNTRILNLKFSFFSLFFMWHSVYYLCIISTCISKIKTLIWRTGYYRCFKHCHKIKAIFYRT